MLSELAVLKGVEGLSFCLPRTLKMKLPKPLSEERPVIHGIQRAPRNITAFAGLRPMVDLWEAFGLSGLVEETLSVKKRNRGFAQADFMLSSVLLQLIGGNGVDDIERLREDPELRDMLGLAVPAKSTTNDFFNGFTMGHVRQLEILQRRALAAAYRRDLDPDPTTATLDCDSTYATVYGHQQGADRLYTGEIGFHPIGCFRAETREAVRLKLRRGHASSAGDTDELIQFVTRSFASLPVEFPNRRFRADSAFCVVALLNWLDAEGIEYAITARMTTRIEEAIVAIPEESWAPEPGGEPDPGGRKHRPHAALEAPEIAECEVKLVGGRGDRCTARLVVRRRRAAKVSGLYKDGDTKYHAVVTNRAGLAGAELLTWANGRGDVENCIREAKSDLDTFGCGFRRFAANAAWMHVGMLAYNLMCWLRLSSRSLPLGATTWQTRTWRTHFFSIPGYLARTGRRCLLTLATTSGIFTLFRDLSAALSTAYGG